MKTISGNIIDVPGRKIFPGTINIDGKKISDIKKESNTYKNYILPGFIDAHVHIESSMLVPSEFARAAVRHGTIATVSDPHEIANVLGMEGVRFMIDNARKVPFKIYFGAPSCVPATAFETSGAVISPQDIKELFEKQKDIIKLIQFKEIYELLENTADECQCVAKTLEKVVMKNA